MAERILGNEFKELSKPGANPWLHVEVGTHRMLGFRTSRVCSLTLTMSVQLGKGDNLMMWDVALIVLNPTSLYYGGYLKVGHTSAILRDSISS
jgi:hypothetical protein